MTLDTTTIKAVIFDYGNTLIEFGPEQVVIMNDNLHSLLENIFGPCDKDEFTAIRKQQIIAPYSTEEYIENDREGICVELVDKLYGINPDDSQIREMLDLKYHAFVDAVSCSSSVLSVLDSLKNKYRLAFISNYPCTESITDSLEKLGLYSFFESIVISGEMGIIKPHSDIFKKSLVELKLKPEECVYVGDNWLADIQGAKRIGMQAIHTTQYVSYEKFEPYEGDFNPDTVITHLEQLTDILL